MELASRKTRTIERKLKKVEALPVADENEFYEIDTPGTYYTYDENSENQ